MKLPGTRLLALARFIVDPATAARVLEPLVADWQREWLSAPTTLRRLIVRTRGAIAFLTASGQCFVSDPTPRGIKRTAYATMAIFGGLSVALEYAGWIELFGTRGALWLVPGSIVLSPCFAMLPLALRLGAERGDRTAARRYLARTAFILMACTFVTTNWIFPVWNRTLRDQLAPPTVRRPLAFGSPELTLPQLLSGGSERLIQVPTLPPPPGLDQRREVVRELHNRATLVLTPAVLAFLGWTIARTRVPARWWSLALATTLNFILWVALRGLAPLIPLPPLASLWAPLVVAALLGAAFAAVGGAKALPPPISRHR